MSFAMVLFAFGCADTGGREAEIALFVAGTEVTEPFAGRDGVTLTLDRADLAFGPLYLCAGFQAGGLCEEALAQWTDAVVIDTLDPTVTPVGTMDAVSGTASSYMYDLGIVSRLTTPGDPLITDAAAELLGSSVVLEGRATVEGTEIPFEVAVAIQQGEAVEQGVPVVRSSESDAFSYEITDRDDQTLRVRFDPRPWLGAIRFDGLLEDRGCVIDAPLTCAGSLEQTCAPDGTVSASRDCAALDQVCLREMGCVDGVRFEEGSQGWRAVRSGVEAGARPSLEP